VSRHFFEKTTEGIATHLESASNCPLRETFEVQLFSHLTTVSAFGIHRVEGAVLATRFTMELLLAGFGVSILLELGRVTTTAGVGNQGIL